MNLIKLKKLKLQGFRGFIDLNEISEFPETGLVAIKGYNRNTGGSSGAGKSSIGYAILYALGLLSNASKHQNKQSDVPMQVELVLNSIEGEIVIKRGETTSISINGIETKGAIAKVNEKIASVFGMPLELLEPLIMRFQKQSGFFLSMTDSEKKDFLGELLGLTELEIALETSNEQFKELENKYKVIESLYNTKVAETKEPAKPTLQPLIVAQSLLETQTKELQELNPILARLESVRDQIIKEIDELDLARTPVPEIPSEPEKPLKLLELTDQYKNCVFELIAITQIIEDHNNRIKALNELKEKSAAALARIDSLRQIQTELKTTKECKVCSSLLPDDRAKKAYESYEAEIVQINGSFTPIEYIDQQITRVLSEITETKSLERQKQMECNEIMFNQRALEETHRITLDQYRLERASLIKAYGDLENKRADQRRALSGAMVDNIGDINSIKSEIDLLTNLINRGKAQNEKIVLHNSYLESNYQQSLINWQEQLRAIDTLKSNLDSVKRQLDAELDFQHFVKNYLGGIFSELLDEIAQETNQYLAKLPNVATVTIAFSTTKTTQKGVVKQEIKPIILKSGTVFDQLNLSGGQMTSVELAVDLAVNKVILRRLGRGPGWIMLDEAFDGHDSAVKEGCLELLTLAAVDAIVLVVDHSLEFKEYFTKSIEVECIGDVSRICTT